MFPWSELKMGTGANHPDGNAGLVNMKLMGALLKISIKNKSASTKSFSWQYSNIETNAFYQSGYYILDAAPAPNSSLEYVPEADPYLHTGIPPASDPSATPGQPHQILRSFLRYSGFIAALNILFFTECLSF